MAYEFAKRDLVDFANVMRYRTHEKGNELFFEFCPYCNGGGHKDKDTFSVNTDNGTFNCFRAGCGKQGHFVELARDFGFKLDFGDVPKQYRRLQQKPIVVRSAAVEYMKKRGISEKITQKYKITTQIGKDNILVFPFYDENNILQSVKYRNAKHIKGQGSKEWAERDTKRILFGMAQCEDFERLVITEGQIDSLSVAEAGIKNAVSVPNGAMGFTWLTECWNWIIQFKDVVVFGDNEKGKVTLFDELHKRLPQAVKVVRVEDYLGEKDANDILLKYGRDAVVKCVENASVPEMPNVKRLADVKSVDIYKLPGIKTGIREIDAIIKKMYFGQVILLTGKRGGGKSTVLSQIGANAINQGFPALFYSGELTDYHFKRWLDFQLAGPDNLEMHFDEFDNEQYSISEKTVTRINNWYRDLAYIYDNSYLEDGQKEFEGLLNTVETAIKQYGIKLVCIDNLMTALDVEVSGELYHAQSNFVGKLKKLAVKYDCVVILVAHPRKESKGDVDWNDSVSGSSDITNKVDVVMRYDRASEEDECDGKIKITKNRLVGILTGSNDIELFYSHSTKRITSVMTKKIVYGWELEKDNDEEDGVCPF